MKQRTLLLALILAGLTGAAQVQAVFDNTTNSYGLGNLAGQHDWTLLQNYGTNGFPYPPGQSNQLGQVPFDVDNSDWVTTAGTDADFLTTTNGSFVYLDKTTGNAEDQVWTTTFDFNISVPDNGGAAHTMPNAEFFYVGLTASTTNGLNEFDKSDACFILRTRAENGRLDVNFQDGDASAMRIIQSRPEDIGWAPEAVMDDGTSVAAVYQTDDLRLILSLRKSREDNTYIAWATLTNLNSTYSTTGTDISGPITNKVVVNTFLTDAYAASDLKIAMGRSSQAYHANLNGMLDLDVDALSVEVSSVPPTLVGPGNASASPYDGLVNLSWDAVTEADSYIVLRSISPGGSYSTITNLTDLSYVDTSVMNDTTYYYVIQADFGASGTADSVEVFATPQAISTGTLISTDFIGYNNGDLAGQDGWEQVSGSAVNAFNVIGSGTSTAAVDTVTTTASFSTNTGNAVYLDKLTDNVLYDAWEGHIDFVLSAPQTAGTNISLFSNQDVLAFGISANREAPLFLESDDQMALMSVKVRANGKLVAMFADELNDNDNTRLATLLYGTETGWDPQALSAAYDNVSDTIRYSWKIRKSSVDGTYQAFGSLSNLTTGVAHGNTQVTVPFVTEVKQGMYDNPSATFVMGHYYKAKFSPAHELVNVTVQDMSVSHSADNQPEIIAPEVGTLGGDRSVMVNWNDTFEASDYDVLLAESAGGTQIVLTNVTSLSYLDSPRFNGVTNWYTVRANFPTGSADSIEVAGAPFASVKYVNLDGVEGNIVSANYPLDQVTGLTTNTGGTIMYLNHMTNSIMSSAEDSRWINVPVYDLVQNDTVGINISTRTGTTGYEVKHNTGNATQLTADSVDLRPQGSSMKQLAFVIADDWVEFDGAAADMTQDKHTITIANKLLSGSSDHRVAIRNGGLWYVNAQVAGSGLLADLEAGRITVTNVVDEAWAPIGDNGFVDPDILLTDPAGANFTTALNWTFTNVNAVGWFFSGSAGGRLKNYELTYSASGSAPSLDYWAANNNVTNLYEDIDGDNLINIDEYAFGGDPNDGNDLGILKQFTKGIHLGTEGFYYVHAESRDPDPGIAYSVETTDELLLSFAPGEAQYLGEAPIDYYFKSVTNFIPADTDAKFVGLEVTEQ